MMCIFSTDHEERRVKVDAGRASIGGGRDRCPARGRAMREAEFFHGRNRRTVRRAALAALGIALSLCSGKSEALAEAGLNDGTMTAAAGALAVGLVLASGAVMLARRRSHRAARETRVSRAVAAIRPGADEADDPSIVPRSLPHSPFADTATLESQIEIAAEACARLNRTIGVIYFEVPGFAQIALRDGKRRADAIVSALAEALRHQLRASDHLAVLDGRRIVVCLCLLDKAADIAGVARRLAAVVSRHRSAAGEGAQVRPGFSVYPPGGCSGSELIAAAMQDYRARLRSPDVAEEVGAPAPSSQDHIPDRRPTMRRRLTVVSPPPEGWKDPTTRERP